jgi:hypothetical protein
VQHAPRKHFTHTAILGTAVDYTTVNPEQLRTAHTSCAWQGNDVNKEPPSAAASAKPAATAALAGHVKGETALACVAL